MKIRIREGNDFDVAWAIKRGGVPENFATAVDMRLTMVVYGRVIDVTLPENPFTGNVLSLNIPKEVATILGDYRLVFEYTLPDLGQPDGDLKCKTDVVPFRIVPFTAQADDIYTIDVASDVAIGFKGDKGEDGDDAYQIWLDLGNVGTYEDYIAYLRAPAVEAGASIAALELIIEGNESGRVTAEGERDAAETLRLSAESGRATAEGLRDGAEVLRIAAEGIRDNNEGDRILAESDRADAEELRDGAELLRQTAESERIAAEILREANIQAAIDAAALANTKAGLADTAAAAANTATGFADAATIAANTAAGNAQDVADTVDGRVTAVEADLVQLAGEVSDSTEKAGAASLAELNARLLALEKIVSSTLRSKIEVTKEFNVWGRTNLILYGTGANTKAPDFIGQKYIDTAGGNVYVAVGTTSAGNWKLV